MQPVDYLLFSILIIKMKKDRARLKAMAMNRDIPDSVFRRIVIMAIDSRGYHETFTEAMDRLELSYLSSLAIPLAEPGQQKNIHNFLLHTT